MEEWSEDSAIELRDARESVNLGSADEIKEECFDRVVEMVSGEDKFGSVFLPDCFEEGVSFSPSSLFESFFGCFGDAHDISSSKSDNEIIFFTKLFHCSFISITFCSSEMMVEMSDDDMIHWMK